ncbi:hypothetical protein OPIT5_08290 [Opitutaceae bacterium TAV5]|nr:hypothetical protein OPIT5_08290 [Opitutaceae bacterium TAV5]
MNPVLIRKTILIELASAPEMLTEGSLLLLVKQRIPEVTKADLVQELVWLRDHGYADYVADTWDLQDRDLNAWKITTNGRLSLK